MKDMTGLEMESAFKNIFVVQIVYIASTGIIKMSFAVTLLRVVRERAHVWFLRGILVLTIISCIAFTTNAVFGCLPVDYFWKQAIDPYVVLQAEGADPAALGYKARGYCKGWDKEMPAAYTQIADLVFLDLVLGVIMPIVVLRDIHMAFTVKLQTGLILGFAALPSAASVARLFYVRTIQIDNFFVTGQPFFFWSSVEQQWCLIAAACAMLKPLVTGRRAKGKTLTPMRSPGASDALEGTNRSRSRWADTELTAFDGTKMTTITTDVESAHDTDKPWDSVSKSVDSPDAPELGHGARW